MSDSFLFIYKHTSNRTVVRLSISYKTYLEQINTIQTDVVFPITDDRKRKDGIQTTTIP